MMNFHLQKNVKRLPTTMSSSSTYRRGPEPPVHVFHTQLVLVKSGEETNVGQSGQFSSSSFPYGCKVPKPKSKRVWTLSDQ